MESAEAIERLERALNYIGKNFQVLIGEAPVVTQEIINPITEVIAHLAQQEREKANEKTSSDSNPT